jgi:hypothetical protein
MQLRPLRFLEFDLRQDLRGMEQNTESQPDAPLCPRSVCSWISRKAPATMRRKKILSPSWRRCNFLLGVRDLSPPQSSVTMAGIYRLWKPALLALTPRKVSKRQCECPAVALKYFSKSSQSRYAGENKALL